MKWIISDLDGTLLNDDRTVGIKTISGIRTLLKKGYPFVIATGRGFASANSIREKLGVAIYMICNNGATIYSPKGELIFENYIPVDVVKKVTAYLEKHRVDYRGFFQNYYFMPSYGRKDEKRVEYKAVVLEREKDFQHLEKLLVVDPNTDLLRKIQVELQEEIGKDLTISLSSSECLDINSKNCSKATGIQKVASYLSLDLKDAIAFGDSENDFAMLASVGKPVSMKGTYAAQEKEYEVTEYTNHEDGVIRHLEKYIKF